MVVRISTGKSVQGVLRYNEQKRSEGKAELIAHPGFFAGAEQLTTLQLGKRFEARLDLNRRTKTHAVHISLNFAPGEKLDKGKLEEISKAYLERIGFDGQPCLIYQHHDAGHPHVHLVTVNIDAAGKRIETHNLGRSQSEQARKELEIHFGLVPAEKQNFTGADISQLGRLKYGAQPSKAGMNTVLNHVWHNYVFSSLGEFNAIFRCYGMEASPGDRESQRFKRGGLVYQLLDGVGKRVGVPVKASSFYLKPTLKKLEARYQRDLGKRVNLLPQVRAKVLQEFSASESLEQLESKLRKKGVQMTLNHTADGRLFGVTYVDHTLRTAIKGSDLGKGLGATGLRDRFGLENPGVPVKAHEKTGIPQRFEEVEKLDSTVLTSEEFSLDLGNLSDSDYQGAVPQRKRKRKKKDPNRTES